MAAVPAACAHPRGLAPEPSPEAGRYAQAIRHGSEAQAEALSSRKARATMGKGALARIPPDDHVDAAVAIEAASRRPQAPIVRAEGPGLRGVELSHSPRGWRLASVPLVTRSASVDGAVSAFVELLDERDVEALLLLLGDRREPLTREIAERGEAVRTKRGAVEINGAKARVRVADSWWLLIEATPAGWKVVGTEP